MSPCNNFSLWSRRDRVKRPTVGSLVPIRRVYARRLKGVLDIILSARLSRAYTCNMHVWKNMEWINIDRRGWYMQNKKKTWKTTLAGNRWRVWREGARTRCASSHPSLPSPPPTSDSNGDKQLSRSIHLTMIRHGEERSVHIALVALASGR